MRNRKAKDVGKTIRDRNTGILLRLGTITAQYPGPPRTVDATVGGKALTDIPVMDQVSLATSVGCWFASLGNGRIIGIGSINGLEWVSPISLSSPNWVEERTLEWHYDGSRVWFVGQIKRITSSFGTSGNFLALGSGGNPPVPNLSQTMLSFIQTAGGAWSPCMLYVDTSIPSIRTTSLGPTIQINDHLSFEGLSYAV